MEKSILIAGKDLPEVQDFADGFSLKGYTVTLAGKSTEKELTSPSGTKIAPWNKSSSISARSLVIQAEINSSPLENVALYFDATSFTTQFTNFSISNCSKALETMISSYQFLTLEALKRYEEHNTNGKLIFILKTHPSYSDFIHSPNLKSSSLAPANPFITASEAAFANFAENIASFVNDKKNISVLLITGDKSNSVMQNDSALASWLVTYLDAYNALKTKPSAKVSTTWIKAGAKNPSAFPFFK